MQWDVINILSFMIDAIINDQRNAGAEDFVITLHIPPETDAEYQQGINRRFQNRLSHKGDIQVVLAN
eukprot:7995418-Prorocentrum_lima.AAC.1